MKTKIGMVAIVFVSGLVLAGCGQQQVQTGQQEQQQNQQQTQEETFSGSLKDLMGLGKSVQCTWQYQDEQSSMTGTVWSNGTKSKTETTTTANGQTIAMSFVTDGQTAWMWQDNTPQGFKYNVVEMEKQPETNNEGENLQYADKSLLDNYDYNCQPWKADEAVFTVPTDIQFVDMAQQMEQLQQQTQQMQQNMSGVCNNLPEPQKSQCLESLQ